MSYQAYLLLFFSLHEATSAAACRDVIGQRRRVEVACELGEMTE